MKMYFHKHVKIKHYKRALIKHMPCASLASLVAQLVNNLPTMQETWVRSPGEGNGYPLQYSGKELDMTEQHSLSLSHVHLLLQLFSQYFFPLLQIQTSEEECLSSSICIFHVFISSPYSPQLKAVWLAVFAPLA